VTFKNGVVSFKRAQVVCQTKCVFYQKKIHYLGNNISEDGITMDLENIEAIRGWKTPKNVIDVRSFMGLYDYY
jgi:hypothetical protein